MTKTRKQSIVLDLKELQQVKETGREIIAVPLDKCYNGGRLIYKP